MSRARLSVPVSLFVLAGAVAAAAGSPQQERYRLVERTVLVFQDPSGVIDITPLHGTFDLVPSMIGDEYLIRDFRGFSQDTAIPIVRGHGIYRRGPSGQTAILDLVIRGEPRQLIAPPLPPPVAWPMIEFEAREISPPGAPFHSLLVLSVPAMNIVFTTEGTFDTPFIGVVSGGDVASLFGWRLWTNAQLVQNFNIPPPVPPEIGCDALYLPPGDVTPRQCWFSTEIDVFSATHGWLRHGDFLNSLGTIVAREGELLFMFDPLPPVGLGLDAITWSWGCQGWYFSTEDNFFSRRMGAWVGHGDVLCARDGWVFMSNAALRANFRPTHPVVPDLGLDALYLWPTGQIWFSLEEGFTDQRYGPISDGDLLSTDGWVIYRNADLLRRFQPQPPLDYGLDGVHVQRVAVGDMNGDTRINLFDIDSFVLALTNREEYYQQYPELNPDVVGDCNGDGVLNAFDIDAFVRLLTPP